MLLTSLLQTTRAKTSDSRLSISPQKQQHTRRNPDPTSGSTHIKRKRVHLAVHEEPPSTVSRGATAENIASSSRITIDATPDPKPRKQLKRSLVLSAEPRTPITKASKSHLSPAASKDKFILSPHASNPRADYVPPLTDFSRSAISSHRSATPVPRYESLRDRFTPPREVIYTPLPPVPSVSKSSKRKSIPWSRSVTKAKSKERRLTIQIKKEPPEIDLSTPLPPASPTDDPLLLYGSTSRKTAARPSLRMASTYSRDTPPISSSSPGPVDEGTRLLDLSMTGTDLDMITSDTFEATANDRSPPNIVARPIDDADSSEEELHVVHQRELRQNAHLTGKFRVVTVPTKMDPPSSVTRERMDRWGRPVSPFPFEARQSPMLGYPSDEDVAHTPTPSPRADEEAESVLLPPPTSSSPSLPPSAPSSPMHPMISPAKPRAVFTEDEGSPQLHPPVDHDLGDEGDTIIEYDVPLAGDDDSSPSPSTPQRDVLDGRELHASETYHLENLTQNTHNGYETALTLTSERDSNLMHSEDYMDETHLESAPSSSPAATQQWDVDALSVSNFDSLLDDTDAVDIEEAESVVRELSYEPDFRDDEPDHEEDILYLRQMTPEASNSHAQVMASPHNPFDVYSSPNSDSAGATQLVKRQTNSAAADASQSNHVDDAALTTPEEMDEDSDLTDLDPGIVKISSEDPMAAARAAAILRLVCQQTRLSRHCAYSLA